MSYEFSRRFSFVSADIKKIFVGAGIALLGALATYMQDSIPAVDFGNYTLVVMALNSVLVNAIRMFISERTYVE